MKSNLVSKKTVVIIIMFMAITITVSQCKCTGGNKENPYEKAEVNPAFATNPPLATSINISEINPASDSGNLLIEATMPKEKIKSDVLAVMISDSTKAVLHDDGRNGDKVAGDGIYSIVMNVDTDSLRTYIAQQATVSRQLLEQTKGQLFQFEGRMEFPVSAATLTSVREFSSFSLDKINLKEKFNFLNPAIIHLLFPVSEAFKHTALTITDPSVINDPARTFNPCNTAAGHAGGAWTFGKLMTDMAATSGITPENFVLNWLNTWNSNPTVNNDQIPGRPAINTQIINVWHTLCGGPAAPLDVNKAPFKLIAIVNRFDLRSGGAYGGGNAGEGRFVFSAIDANCQPLSPGFLVIFEYGVNKTTCASIHAYAQEWIDLASLPFPSAAYNDALQHITDQFALAGTNPGKPNGSSLDQLRTNEVSLAAPWELREFQIDATSHQLTNVTTKREPQIPFNSVNAFGIANTTDIEAFGDFANANERDIINDKMDLPATVGTGNLPFIAGKARVPNPPAELAYHWDATEPSGTGHITNDTVRFHISLNTCSGCHGGETETAFKQIDPLGSTSATLSKFLTGDPPFSSTPFLVPDRAGRPSASAPIQWPFNDLERRGRDLLHFASLHCFAIPSGPLLINQHVPVWAPVELVNKLTFNPVTMSD
ncbi:MAG TPA: choice-of-anchor X domain-containing protein [Chitinophagaceae bacterium]|nr:choice-of-anchor X domain-containing protein [Chitinophagaceae bacterium]